MKIVLLKSVPKLGKKHEVVNVADGFAYNHLFPKKFAIPATKGAVQKASELIKKEVVRKEEIAERAVEYKKTLEGKKFSIQEKVTDKGHLYGSIGEKEIVALVLKEANIELDKSAVKLGSHIKDLGEHNITIKLSEDIEANITVTIEALEEEEK